MIEFVFSTLSAQTGYAVPESASGGLVDQLALDNTQFVPERDAMQLMFHVTVLNGTQPPP